MNVSANVNTDGVHKIGKDSFDRVQGWGENNVQSVHKFICINCVVYEG